MKLENEIRKPLCVDTEGQALLVTLCLLLSSGWKKCDEEVTFVASD